MLTITLLFVFCCVSTVRSQILYKCDFEESCEDFIFDSHWFVANVSGHIDRTYGNLSGHYITYKNTSHSEPLIVFRTRDWVDTVSNQTTCLSLSSYAGPGSFRWTVELAQGDDLQARQEIVTYGYSGDDPPQWRDTITEIPYTNHFVLLITFRDITSSLDLDDIKISSCPASKPIPVETKAFDCDFDQTSCPDLISLPGYSYSWSIVQANDARNYTRTASAIDHSVGDGTGHYIWLNNSDLLREGGVGYLRTNLFRFDRFAPTFCLSFRYYRYGSVFPTGSKLTVFALKEYERKSLQQVWPIDPNDYNYINERWTWAYAPLFEGAYSLLFRVETEHAVLSSFALDSISVSSCDYIPRRYRGTSHLDFVCDFEPPLGAKCGMRDYPRSFPPQSMIGFTEESLKTISDRELGPKQTTGWSGDWFLYWSRSDNTSKTLINGLVKTPPIETNPDTCIRFAYFVNSTDIESKKNNTQLRAFSEDCGFTLFWSINLDTSFGWQLVTKQFSSNICTKSIYFEITQKQPSRVAVAFDDISIVQCNTLNVLTTTVSPLNVGVSKYINYMVFITALVFLLKIQSSYQ